MMGSEVGMVRIVVQLTEKQFAALRALSARRRRPLTELLRQGVDSVLAQGTASADAKRRALAASGRFRSGLGDLARRHDHYLGKRSPSTPLRTTSA
jgi:hypothetical protein